MKKSKAQPKRSNRYIRSLLVSGLTLSNLLPFAAPVLAAGTQGGTNISNTATATFDNPNGGTTVIQSNTVQITVAEVAGISVTNSGFTDTNGSSVTTDDVLYYDFRITNTGNDATRIYFPAPVIAGADLVSYTIISENGTTVSVTIPSGGSLSSALSGLTANGVLQADQYYTVRVEVQVTANSVGAPVTVTLGETNDAAENVTTEVRTVDNTTAVSGEADPANPPINGEQEGTATRTVNVGTAPKYQAFATVLKTNDTPILNNVTTAQDDVVEYGLQLRVANNAPAGTSGYTVTDLQPVESVKFSTAKNTAFGSATNKNVVIISDVIPTNTRLSVSGDAGYEAPAVPTDSSGVVWKVWYAYNSSVNASNVSANSPLEEVWTDQAPADATEAATVKRIAFVKEGAVARGVTTTSGTFRVVTNGVATNGGDIFNIAQIVGQSEAGTDKNLVYDESGDQNPNNFDGSNPGSDSDYTPSQFNDNANTETGNVTDLGGTGLGNQDPGNNTGSGASGEVNKVTIGAPVAAGLLNGPSGSPSATGPNNTHDDFTNKSIDVAANSDQSASVTIDPAVVEFTNTVASAATLNNVVIRPIGATQAAAVDSNTADDGSYTVDTALPDTTSVTVIALVNGAYQSATYTYSSGSGSFTLSSSKSGTAADGSGGTTDSAAKPILYPTFVGGQTYNYTVQVNLPNTAQTLKGYSVPMVAYVEGDLPGTADYGVLNLSGNADQAPNVTIDRVYTGFMKVLKEVRIVDAAGADISDTSRPGISTFTTAPAATSQPKPGERIVYRISYENISSQAGSSSGSVVLNAANFMVIEDGLASPNNWAGYTTNVQSAATGSAGSVTFYNSTINIASPGSGVSESSSISGYVNTVGTVAPAGTGTFTFHRALN